MRMSTPPDGAAGDRGSIVAYRSLLAAPQGGVRGLPPPGRPLQGGRPGLEEGGLGGRRGLDRGGAGGATVGRCVPVRRNPF